MKSVIRLCRYFKYELLAKQAISKENLPIFLTTWVDRSNAACMFSASQQRTWTTSHLTGGAWYLDCVPSFTPSFEIELRKSRDAIGESGIEMLDLQGIEDESERAKALARRIEEDRKKAQKVREAEERALQKELEKEQKAKEKSTRKGKKKASTPGQGDMNSPTTKSGQNEKGNSRGTKRRSSYDQLNQLLEFNDAGDCGHNDEMILNSSLKDVLAGNGDDYTPMYIDIKLFLLKVKHCACILN